MKAWRTAHPAGIAPRRSGLCRRRRRDFSYSKELARGTGAAAGEEILSFTLDNDVYAAVREGFPDLRILDRTGAKSVCAGADQ